jgi:hypothetical protein
MTVVLITSVLLMVSSLGRSAVLIALSYMALRRSRSQDRPEILQKLGTALAAARQKP